jgi:GT2 family glycosyltransferase
MKVAGREQGDFEKTIQDHENYLIVLIILTYNQKEKTIQCIDDLYRSGADPIKIVVWDNGSQDGTKDVLQHRYPEILYHHHTKNLGVAGGRNAAARLAIETFHPTHLLFLDNDMQVEPGFVEALYEPFKENNHLGQTQAKLRFMYDRARLNDGGGCQINFVLGRTHPVGFGEVDRGQYDTPKACIACGGAMMVRTEIFESLGGFDEVFSPFGPEDLDFSLRLQNAGYTSLYVPKAVAYHQVSHSFSDGYSEHYARHKSKHWLTFLRRHASPLQKLGFFTIGAPFLLTRMIIREGKKGNLGALRGTVRGLFEKK